MQELRWLIGGVVATLPHAFLLVSCSPHSFVWKFVMGKT